MDYKITSDAFFAQNKERFDCIFIDGLHTLEQSLKDFYNAWEVLNKGGAVVFHDTNPPSLKLFAYSLLSGFVSVGFEYHTQLS